MVCVYIYMLYGAAFKGDFNRLFNSAKIRSLKAFKNISLKTDIKDTLNQNFSSGGKMDLKLLWKDEYCLGHNAIDFEHKKLFDIANQIFAIGNPRVNSERIKGLVLELYDYMKHYFEHEEKFMAEISYTEASEHKQKHQKILEEMDKVLSISEGFNVLEMNLAYIMQEWFAGHILNEDKKIMERIESYELKLYYRYCRPGLHS